MHPSTQGASIQRIAARLLTFAALLLRATHVTASPAETIPAVHCEALSGQPVNLPEDLHGRPAVLVIGFSRASQAPVRDWGRRLAADFAASPATSTKAEYYELAMLEAVPRIARTLVVRAIRKDVSPAGQTHFLPITQDEAAWRRLAHYDRPDDAYVVLVDPSGTVRWTTSGPLTEVAYGELKKRLLP